MSTEIYDRIHEKWLSLYLDQGGSLTLEQRDQAFTEAMDALKKLETQLSSDVLAMAEKCAKICDLEARYYGNGARSCAAAIRAYAATLKDKP